MLSQAQPQTNIECECGSIMKFDHQDFSLNWEKPSLSHVEMMYRCSKCKLGARAYADGSNLSKGSKFCEQCKVGERVHTFKDKVSTTTCTKCDFLDVFDYSLEADEASLTPEEIKSFEADKARFCLDNKRGTEYLDQSRRIKWLNDQFERKEVHQKARDLKRLSIIEMQKLIKTKLKKHAEYSKLKFGAPEDGRFLQINFSLLTNQEMTDQYDSKKELKKKLDTILSETNWNLMNDGITYRMGLMKGRLRALETDEEIMKKSEKLTEQ